MIKHAFVILHTEMPFIPKELPVNNNNNNRKQTTIQNLIDV